MNLLFLLSLLVTAAMTIPLNPEEQITAQHVSHPTSSSTPASVKVASPTKSDPDQILGSKQLIDKESDESDESDESKESNETAESQNSKEENILPSHQANVTKTVQPSKDFIVDVSAPQVPNTKPDPPSFTLVETIATVQMSEPDAVPAVPTLSDATFLPFKREPNAKSPEESQMLNTN